MNVKILIIHIITDFFAKCNRFGGFCFGEAQIGGTREGELLEKFPLDPLKTFWEKF
jgi:hypothetical protein